MNNSLNKFKIRPSNKNKLSSKTTLLENKRVLLANERTLLADERTLLAQIRTASIFIGITYLVFYKIADGKKFFTYIVGFILLVIFFTNIFSMKVFYKKTGEKFDENNIIPIIYGSLLSILILISLFYIIYYSINKKKIIL
tara:strand:+ start:346 stop:768 length:423 start_codon:yes stop_codon:yes gene_type:complete